MKKLQAVNNLATVNQSDFTITKEGGAFITTTKAAELIGIPRTSLQDWIKKNSAGLNLNKKSQLDHKSFQKAVYFGTTKNIAQAIDLLDKIMEAGAKAFIYNQAGYNLIARPAGASKTAHIRDMLDAMDAHDLELERLEAVKAEQSQVDALEKVVRGSQCPHGYLPAYKMALFFNEPLNKTFKSVLAQVKYVKYPFVNGNGGIQKDATAYNIEEVRIILEA